MWPVESSRAVERQRDSVWGTVFGESLVALGEALEPDVLCLMPALPLSCSVTLDFLLNLFVPQCPHFSYKVISAQLLLRAVVLSGADTREEWCPHLSHALRVSVPEAEWQAQGTWRAALVLHGGREFRNLPFLF